MHRIFEFLLEYITNSDTAAINEDFGQNFNEKIFGRIKFINTLTNWTKQTWTIHELVTRDKPISSKILSVDSNRLKILRKKM